MTPPDEPDLLDVPCSETGCGNQAVDQEIYDPDLCLDHLKEAAEWDRADDRNKTDRGEYGQYETDGKGSY